MRMIRHREERGAALIIAIAVMTVLLAIGVTFFTITRIESDTAANVINSVRAEHLVDAGVAIAQYRLNKDLLLHPNATSLDHGWRTLFNGAAYVGKTWAYNNGRFEYNIEPVEAALRARIPEFQNSILYVAWLAKDKTTGITRVNPVTAAPLVEHLEPLFRGPRTEAWLQAPRNMNNTILIFAARADVMLANKLGQVVDDANVNAALQAAARPERFVRFTDPGAINPGTNNTMGADYPFVTSAYYGATAASGGSALYPPEQVHQWCDLDTDGDGLRDAVWLPLPMDVDLSKDGVDNDLDGVIDPGLFTGNPQTDEDSAGNQRKKFELGAFVYQLDADGDLFRDPTVQQPGGVYKLTVPLPGLAIPVDLNNDGELTAADNGSDGWPVYAIIGNTISVPVGDPTAPQYITLGMADVDGADNDHDLFVNNFSAYACAGPGEIADNRYAVWEPFNEWLPDDKGNPRYANALLRGYVDLNAGLLGVTLSANAPASIRRANGLRITVTGEPVCDIVGRAAVKINDESSKVNLNAAGAHIYAGLGADPAGEETGVIKRAIGQGLSPLEYETRALPKVGGIIAPHLWGMLTGAGMKINDANWDFDTLPIGDNGYLPTPASPNILALPNASVIKDYRFDVSLPGLGRVDDDGNALLLAFAGRDADGDGLLQTGAYLPENLHPMTVEVLNGVRTLYANSNGLPVVSPNVFSRVEKEVQSYARYYRRLGVFEGIDDPGELIQTQARRNVLAADAREPVPTPARLAALAESDGKDNNTDGSTDEIGELGDRILSSSYEIQKGNQIGGEGSARWDALKNVVTANSDSRNVAYVSTPKGDVAVNKLDPNLAPAQQIAAALIVKNKLQSVENQSAENRTVFAFDPADPAKAAFAWPLEEITRAFLGGLRQADTTVNGLILGAGAFVATGSARPLRVEADPILQAMQVAVNLADSRDADPVRSLLVLEKQTSAPFPDIISNPPPEALNERERVRPGDTLPSGMLQNYLKSALGIDAAEQKLTTEDKWWQDVTQKADPTNPAARQDRIISYAAAGADAIRINEIMPRPVRRVEAEAVRWIEDPAVPGIPLDVLTPSVRKRTDLDTQLMLSPSEILYYDICTMPKFDVKTTRALGASSSWKLESSMGYTDANTGNFVQTPILGDNTGWVYTAPLADASSWTTDANDSFNPDVLEFRYTADEGLPEGRYYLTMNMSDPLSGAMTLREDGAMGAPDELQYLIKYVQPGQQTISESVAIINASRPPDTTSGAYSDWKTLATQYFDQNWATVDDAAYIAGPKAKASGSGEPVGWVFLRNDPPKNWPVSYTFDNLTGYIDIVVANLDPTDPSYAQWRGIQTGLDDLIAELNNQAVRDAAYFSDGFGGYPVPLNARTQTVIVPPKNQGYLCIGVRLKPTMDNAGERGAGGNITVPRRLAVNFLDFSQEPDHEYVELANTTDKTIDLSGWTLEVGIPDPPGLDDDSMMRDPFKSVWRAPEGARIAPKGYLLLGFTDLGLYDPYPSNPTNALLPYYDPPLSKKGDEQPFVADLAYSPPTAFPSPLTSLNGIGLAAGAPDPNPDPLYTADVAAVTAPPMADYSGTLLPTTPPTPLYGGFFDPTGSVFRREDYVNPVTGAVTPYAYDYVDNDGDGISSRPAAVGNIAASLDTDKVAGELATHGDRPWGRIVALENIILWWENPYSGSQTSVTLDMITADMAGVGVKRLAKLILRGGVLPNYPEHDGYDNDGDGGYITTQPAVIPGLDNRVYVRGTLDKDMIDNNLDGRIDECGMQQRIPVIRAANPLESEGVDEGNYAASPWLAAMLYSSAGGGVVARRYGPGSYEPGVAPMVLFPNAAYYRGDWQGILDSLADSQNHAPVTAPDGATFTGPRPDAGFPWWMAANRSPQIFLAYPHTLLTQPMDIPVGMTFQDGNTASPVYYKASWTPLEGGVSANDAPDWIAFCERRWNPGDNVIVTLYAGDSRENKVADKATYTEGDVINRTKDDIVDSPYKITDISTGALLYDVCLDTKHPSFWLPNQMGLDFYRSLERKHPLYAGDRFGVSNRWEATDGAYDDWAESPAWSEAAETRHNNAWLSRDPIPPRFSNLNTDNANNERLFRHAMAGSPLRMNLQARLWENPSDLWRQVNAADSLIVDPLGQYDPGILAGAVAADGCRQFGPVETTDLALGSPATYTTQGVRAWPPETASARGMANPAFSLRRAEVRNRPFATLGDLMRLPLVTLDQWLNHAGKIPFSGDSYVPRIASAALNTRYFPASGVLPQRYTQDPTPGNNSHKASWRVDTALQGAVLPGVNESAGDRLGFAAAGDAMAMAPLVLSVGSAQFTPLWPNPVESPVLDSSTGESYARLLSLWESTETSFSRIPPFWMPVYLFGTASQPDENNPAYPRYEDTHKPNNNMVPYPDYPPYLRAWGDYAAGALRPPNAAAGMPVSGRILPGPYFFQEEFLKEGDATGYKVPTFGFTTTDGNELENHLSNRWPMKDRVAMYVSRNKATIGKKDGAEALFTWDAGDGLENGTYVAYVGTFIPGMQQRFLELKDAVNRTNQMTISMAAELGLQRTRYPLLATPRPSAGYVNPFVYSATTDVDVNLQVILELDPAVYHKVGDPRFEPVLALEFITDPRKAGRMAPPLSALNAMPDAEQARREAQDNALPHPTDWVAIDSGNGQPVTPAFRANGDGLILYSSDAGMAWHPRLVRVTDRFLALRVRNLGGSTQVACITCVILAPARRTSGKINLNTAEPERVATKNDSGVETTHTVFNTLLGLPGVINAAATTRNPGDLSEVLGDRPQPADPMGWPAPDIVSTNTDASGRFFWPAPFELAGSRDMLAGDGRPPYARLHNAAAVDDTLLMPAALANNDGRWTAAESVASLRLGAILQDQRTEYWDGRYYTDLSDLAAGAVRGGTLKSGPASGDKPKPLSNECRADRRFDEIAERFGSLANMITIRSDIFEVLVTVQAGSAVDMNGDGWVDYKSTGDEFVVNAESRGRVIYERRARTDLTAQAGVEAAH